MIPDIFSEVTADLAGPAGTGMKDPFAGIFKEADVPMERGVGRFFYTFYFTQLNYSQFTYHITYIHKNPLPTPRFLHVVQRETETQHHPSVDMGNSKVHQVIQEFQSCSFGEWQFML